MSVHLKNTVKKLIKENNGPLSLEEIIILLKNMPEYQRIKSESLKPTIKNLLKEEKKEKEKLKKETLQKIHLYHFLYKIISTQKNIYSSQILNLVH